MQAVTIDFKAVTVGIVLLTNDNKAWNQSGWIEFVTGAVTRDRKVTELHDLWGIPVQLYLRFVGVFCVVTCIHDRSETGCN